MKYWNGLPLIDDSTKMDDVLRDPAGGMFSRGYVPRDFNLYPKSMFAPPTDIPLISPSEYEARIAEQDAQQSSLEHLYLSGPGGSPRFVNLDQNGNGFCLVPGTRVMMADGTEKAVESILPGDEVVTHKGRSRKVVRPTNREYSGRFVTIYGDGQESVTCTVGHLFYLPMQETWKEAEFLTPGTVVQHRGKNFTIGAYSPIFSDRSNISVHCLDVEEDRSFIANGFAVHNCWAYSTGHTVMLTRMRDNQPLIRMNPHSVASIIKGGRDEGGWCGLSAEFYGKYGCAPEGNGAGEWPLHSLNVSLDTPTMRKSMERFRITEDWIDLTAAVYDRNLTLQQLYTCLLSNMPCAVDFNWWGHSVCAVRIVKVENGSIGLMILNSWKDWGRNGLAVLQGDRAVPDGAICTRVVRAAA